MKVKKVKLGALELTPANMVCWVEDDPRIVKGSKIILKDMPNVLWRVEDVLDEVIQDHQSLYKPWRVGELS